MTKTIFEPFKIKMVEPLALIDAKTRSGILKECHYNPFTIPAKYVTFDFLTDSGTSAMSAQQWAAMMTGDESYAGSESYFRFVDAVAGLTGMEHVIPTHQGRSAEALLCRALLQKGQRVLGNTQFDTTRANIESAGGLSIDLPCAESRRTQVEFPFKGNTDLEALRSELNSKGSEISFFVMTVTNNSIGGQPVSMENIRQVKKCLSEYGIPMIIDAARFAENAMFIKLREPGYAQKSIPDISREMFSYGDAVMMSAKKDAFANIGGFLALHDKTLAETVRREMVITEGFPTYGGLAGRDLDAIAVGLKEVVDENYLTYRLRSVEYLGLGLEQAGFKLVKPFGGHAVYIDALASVPHLPQNQFPAQALSVGLFEAIGLRGVEVGSVMFGKLDESTGREIPADRELVRLAIPRRVYTQSHIDYVVESAAAYFSQCERLPGYRIVEQAKYLRHFTAKFAPLKSGESND